MTEENTATAEMSVTGMTAETLGKDLLAGMLQELRSIPDHWARLSEQQQAQALSRMRESVRTMVAEALRVLVRGGFAAVNVSIEGINIKDGTRITLDMADGDPNRHELYDSKGKAAMLVLINSAEFTTRLDEIRAQSDQKDLFAGDYDPTKDQPGYRRGESPTAPASMSWAELRDKYKIKDEYTADEATQQIKALDDAYAELFKSVYGKLPSELTDEEKESAEVIKAREECMRRMDEPVEPSPPADSGPTNGTPEQLDLLQRLRAVHVYLTLAEVQGFSPQQMVVVQEWADAYAENPDKCKIARPFFLPMPDPSNGNGAVAED